MRKLAQFIVKWRVVFAAIFGVLAVAGIFCSSLVKQNYDMTKYLPDDTDTKQGLIIMQDEFGLNNSVLIMLTVPQNNVDAIKNKIGDVAGVQLVTVDSYKDGKALYIVSLEGDEYSQSSKSSIANIRSILEAEDYKISGSAVASTGLEEALKVEIPIIMVIAIVIIFLVLLFTSHSWLEPIVFALVLLCAVLINMGSNIIFGEISYVTFAVSAILQMALAMDYSIILLHGFTERANNGQSKEEALVDALAYNMRPISSSGLTTIAGLIALLFMSFTIGFDIGIVLAKGILVSLLSVFLFMPALIMIFSRALEKTQHKPLPLGGGGVAKISVSLRAVLPVIMVVIIAGSYILQMGNVYTFSGWEMPDGHEEIIETFGNVNQAVVLIDNKYADDKKTQTEFINSIGNLYNDDGNSAFKSVSSWTNLELSFDSLLGSIDIGEIKPFIEEIVGSNPKVGDIVRLWDECNHDFYNIEIPQKLVADIMDIDEDSQTLDLLYGLIKEDDKVTVGSAVNKIYGINDIPLLGNLIADKIPEDLKKTIEILHDKRAQMSQATNRALSPLIDSLQVRYGLDASIYDVDLNLRALFIQMCNILFGSDNLKVYEFYNMLEAADWNIADLVITPTMLSRAMEVSVPAPLLKIFMSSISNDGDVTVGEFIQFVNQNKDRPLIQDILTDQIISVCELMYLMQDIYTPYANDELKGLLTSLRANFVGKKHSRIILLMDLPKDGDTTFGVLDTVKIYADRYFGDDNYVAGESMTIKDISEAFADDLFKINLVTVLSILLIIALLFRSVTLPFILVLIIQGAIWITMAIYSLLGIPIFFMSYIICICIQMGATIDYGILIASNYRRNRATMQKFEAITQSVKSAMPTILTSGLILIAAGFIIGFVSSVMPIYSIGKLLGLGTIISVLLILFLLPALLYLLDKVISATTWDGVKEVKNEKLQKRRKGKLVAAPAGEAKEQTDEEK